MSERPILFSAPMVRAILCGRKTQTRRIVTPQDSVESHEDGGGFVHSRSCPGYCDYACGAIEFSKDAAKSSPYGAPGDRLWVRETWSTDASSVYPCDPVIYRADTSPGFDPATAEHVRGCKGNQADCYACLRERRGFKWRPSIFMRRHHSRITLEVTGVRVERLQSISEEDARAEGVEMDSDRVPRNEGVRSAVRQAAPRRMA